ncbi:MAG: 50S ribosomal protein L4 [Parcubacteria group bacterium 20-58-5]|nr:MAG: 50S ribosomal protein L4 [Parcubacteria group bacterium 20-58-5]OYV63785.1 MAG: 50S ribosomal protein L4 [Parcubacteria group bacterium 21-58-10]
MATAKKTTKKEYVPIEAAIFSMEGKQVGSTTLPENLFGQPWRADLVHQVTTAMQANLRQNRAHTKDRSEVSGGGKKPWKQKGTGQARHSSTRSPIWRHGGITFGPRSTRDYSEKINKKMRVGALLSVLSKKAKDGEIILVDKFTFAAPKTALAKTALVALAKGADAGVLTAKKKNAALLALASYEANTIKSFGNFGSIETEELRNLNPVDVLSHKYLVIENPEAAFKALTVRAKSK